MPARPQWKDEFYVEAYRLAKQGLTNPKIASAIGVSTRTFAIWRKAKPALRKALEDARSDDDKKATDTIEQYALANLSPELQELWHEINYWHSEDNGVAAGEALLKAGKQGRQSLFLHAVLAFNFDITRATQVCQLSHNTIQHWTRTDPQFAELLDELRFHVGNFYESALTRLVAEGNTAATIFANRTFNSGRGYGQKVQVEHSGSVEQNHNHLVIDVDKLDLPLNVRKQILEAHRRLTGGTQEMQFDSEQVNGKGGR